MREKKVEMRLVREAKKIGLLCWKFSSPGQVGVPDRILMGWGRIWFVELKAPGGKLSAIQVVVHERIRNAGHEVVVIDSLGGVDAFLASISRKGG